MTDETLKPTPVPWVEKLEPYREGKAKVQGVENPIKLSSNESALGPSPKAIEAYEEAAKSLLLYPEVSSISLRETIAKAYGLEVDRVICGNGSDEILGLLGHAYLQPGDEAIFSQHGFSMYKIIVEANGAVPVVAPEKDLTTDVDAILERVTDKTRLVFIANPNNPTGTYLSIPEIKRLHAGLPGNVILVLDGAYAEFVAGGPYNPGIELVRKNENVVMTRTFSKIYALASLRVGWGYCSASVANTLNRVRMPFNVNAAAQAAAMAAVKDVSFTAQAMVHNETWRAWLEQEITGFGLEVTPSVANFLLIHFPEGEGKSAKEADAFLQSQGIIVRRMEEYHLPSCLRVTVGLEKENKKFIEALGKFLAS